MNLKVLFIILSLPFLLANKGGCSQELPTVAQIQLNLPDSVLNCKYAPKSPGRGASRRARAKYIAGLYAAWKDCHGDLATARQLYRKWEASVLELGGDR